MIMFSCAGQVAECSPKSRSLHV